MNIACALFTSRMSRLASTGECSNPKYTVIPTRHANEATNATTPSIREMARMVGMNRVVNLRNACEATVNRCFIAGRNGMGVGYWTFDSSKPQLSPS